MLRPWKKLPPAEEKPEERMEPGEEFDKNDTFAMWIAGMLTVGIPIALILVAIVVLFCLLFP